MIKPIRIFVDQADSKSYFIEFTGIYAVGDKVYVDGIGLCRIQSGGRGTANVMTVQGQATHVGIVLDESASMFGCAQSTVSSLNEYLDTLRQQNQQYRISLATFNTIGTKFRYTDMDIREVQKFPQEMYRPEGGTPLYDATAEMIHFITARKRPNELAMLIVLTDGEENSSRLYTQYQIQNLVRLKQVEGWTVAFLGADLSKEQVQRHSGAMGVSVNNSMSYNKEATPDVFRNLAASTQSFAGSAGATASNVFNRPEGELGTVGSLDPLKQRAAHQQASAAKLATKK